MDTSRHLDCSSKNNSVSDFFFYYISSYTEFIFYNRSINTAQSQEFACLFFCFVNYHHSSRYIKHLLHLKLQKSIKIHLCIANKYDDNAVSSQYKKMDSIFSFFFFNDAGFDLDKSSMVFFKNTLFTNELGSGFYLIQVSYSQTSILRKTISTV